MPDQKTLEILLRIRDMASKELEKFQKTTKETGKTVTDNFKDGEASVKSFISSMFGIPLTLAGIAAALKFVVLDTYKWSQELEKTAFRLGATTEQVQAFQYAAKLTNTDMGAFTSIVRYLADKIDDINKKVPGATDSFEEFNVPIRKIIESGGTSVDVFYAVSEAIQEMDDSNKRNIASLRMLGRQSSEVMPMLNMDLQKLQETMRKENLLVSPEQTGKMVEQASWLSKLWADFGIDIKKTWADITTGIAPNINEIEVRQVSLLHGAERYIQRVKEEKNAVLDAIPPFIIYAEIKRDLADITDKNTGNIRRQIEEMYNYKRTIELSDDANKEFTKTVNKLMTQFQEMQLARQYQNDYADAVYRSGGNAKVLTEELTILSEKYKDNTALQAQINLKIDESIRQSRTFKEAWGSAMKYATDSSINWQKTLIATVDNARTAISGMMYETILRTDDARKAYQNFFKSMLKMITDFMAKKAIADFLVMFGAGALGGGGGGGGGTEIIPYKGLHYEKGGIISAFQGGGITSGPSLALVGEGMQREAVVPLPDNRSIPVKFSDGGGRAVNVTFNILANDTAGFDSLLAKRKSLITGMIVEAMQSNRDFRHSMS